MLGNKKKGNQVLTGNVKLGSNDQARPQRIVLPWQNSVEEILGTWQRKNDLFVKVENPIQEITDKVTDKTLARQPESLFFF